MPDVTIQIGGRSFMVGCQEGEEPYLEAAAQMLDREAQQLVATGQKLTQDRMLLMAGLMLADKALGADEELRSMDRRLAQATREVEQLKARPAPEPTEKVVEKEVVREAVPDKAMMRLEYLAAQAESLAARAAGEEPEAAED